MPSKPAMSWIGRRKEWQKMYKGVDANDRTYQAYNELIDRHQMMADWFAEHGQTDGDEEARLDSLSQANRLRAILETEKKPTMPDVWSVFDGMSDLGVAIWNDRFDGLDRRRRRVPKDQTIAYHVEAYLASKRTNVNASDITPGMYGKYRRNIH